MSAWNDPSYPPPELSWNLCYCRIPCVKKNGVVKRAERYRYLVLEYADGAFWVNRGAPEGFVLLWQPIDAPTGMTNPQIHGARVKRQQQPLPLKNAAEQFIASCGDGNVVEMLDYFEDIFTDALSPASAACNQSEGPAA